VNSNESIQLHSYLLPSALMTFSVPWLETEETKLVTRHALPLQNIPRKEILMCKHVKTVFYVTTKKKKKKKKKWLKHSLLPVSYISQYLNKFAYLLGVPNFYLLTLNWRTSSQSCSILWNMGEEYKISVRIFLFSNYSLLFSQSTSRYAGRAERRVIFYL